MLFNTFGFIFVFLPAALAGFFLLSYRSEFLGAEWLVLASLVFYAAWNHGISRFCWAQLYSISWLAVASRQTPGYPLRPRAKSF